MRRSKWPPDVQEELTRVWLDAKEEGYRDGYSAGADQQAIHTNALVVLVLRNRLKYTDDQIRGFLEMMNEEAGHMEDAGAVIRSLQELQDKA